MKHFRRKVQHGQKLGRTIGFPTLNFHVGRFGDHVRRGVYVCQVFISQKSYQGMIYFGPKQDQKKDCLEMYIDEFSETIYGQWVRFKVGKKIRGVQKFKDLESLQRQLQKDLQSMHMQKD